MRPEHPVALITGASWGIGEATAKLLAESGFYLLLGARTVEKVTALAEELQSKHGIKAIGTALDVRDPESVNAFVELAKSEFGAVHVLVNNAGLAKGTACLEDATDDQWEQMISTNINGVLYMTRACIPLIKAAGWGHIFFLGSVAGHGVYKGGSVYCGTKYFVRAVSETLRFELLGEPIRVTSVDPGMVETQFSVVRLDSKEKADAVYRGMQPLVAEDIAECIRWAVDLPDHVNIDQIIIRPRDQAGFQKVQR